MDTDKLIQMLIKTTEPVRPLQRPWVRCALWLTVSIPYVGLVVFLVSPRPDLMAKLGEAGYLIEQFAVLATGITSAIAAFASTIPGYDRRIVLLPALPLAVWLAALGEGCVSGWLQSGANGLALQSDWFCFPAIILVGAIPAIAMVIMLRRGAPLIPSTTVALGGLAAAGLGNFGLRLFHHQDASLMVLVWQFGTVIVLSLFSGLVGRYVLSWSSIMGMAPR